MNDGKIIFRVDYGGESKLEINTTKKYNNGEWISLTAAREFKSKRNTENGRLKVNSESNEGSPTAPITSKLLPDLADAAYYLGGVPPGELQYNYNFNCSILQQKCDFQVLNRVRLKRQEQITPIWDV